MSTTKLSDLIAHDKEFLATAREAMVDLSVLRGAGVVVGNAELDGRANGPGVLTSVPYWKPLSQNESAIGSDDDTVKLAADTITQGEMLAVKNFRNRAWSAMDIASDLIADDVMSAVASRVGEYWANDEERHVIAILKGILAQDVAGAANLHAGDGTAALDIDLLIDAAGTAGDHAGQFAQGVLVVHSATHRKLQKTQANAYVPKALTNLNFDTYAGYRIIVNDLMPVASTVYTSALLTQGSILAGEGSARTPVEVFRDPASGNGSGQETLYHRRQYILHPNGMKFLSDSVAGKSPTNAECATAANWAPAFNRKNIGIAFISHT